MEDEYDPSIYSDDATIEEKWALLLYNSRAKDQLSSIMEIKHNTDGTISFNQSVACDFAHVLANTGFEGGIEWETHNEEERLKTTHDVVFWFLNLIGQESGHLAKFSVN